MRPQSWINFTRVRGLLVWALVLPAVLAEETATESAGVSRPGPDQEIVDIVSVKDAPPIAGTNIHHQGHAHEHLQVEADEIGSIIQRSSISSSFPTAFDTSLSNNFTTESCPSFFKNFLADPSFTDCHALSTLLRDSTGFFHTLRTAASTSLVLDTACSADVSSCSSTMSSFASDLLADDNCGQDYEAGNPLVANAYYDMITYEPTYRATCLQNPDTSDYCFVDAVTNSSNPVDYDIYFLPYGSTIDSKSTPTCGPCLQATLDIFSEWAQVKDQPLADSYIPSAKAVNGKCGADFAKVNITVGEEDDIPSAAASQRAISFPFWVSLTVGTVLVSL